MFKLLQIQQYVTMLGVAIIFYSYIQFDWVDRWSNRVKRRVYTSKLLIAQQLRKLPNFDPDIINTFVEKDHNWTDEHPMYTDTQVEAEYEDEEEEEEEEDENLYDETQYDSRDELNKQNFNVTNALEKEQETEEAIKNIPKKHKDPRKFKILKMTRISNETFFNYTETPLMVLFSSWVYSKEKADVHEQILRLWNYWSIIKALLITSDPVAKKMALQANWDTLPITRVHKECRGPPVLLDMYVQAMKQFNAYYYGFANSDILFGTGLSTTLRFLHRMEAWQNKPLLVVGRRNNVDFRRHRNATLDSPANVTELRKHGKLVVRSTDYFFTNAIFPWKRVPAVTIGRPYVVRAIIGWALKQKIAIVDVTRTVPAIHLTTKDGVFASWHKAGAFCNEKVLMRLHWTVPTNIGHCECATLETYVDENKKMQLRRRSPHRRFCSRGGR